MFIFLSIHAKQKFGPDCRNPKHIPMDEILRRTILTRHNSQRNVLALGGADDFKRPQAADMATMVNAYNISINITHTNPKSSF